MTTAAHLAKTALANPGTTADGTTYAVAGAVYASLDADRTVHLRLPEADADDLVRQEAEAERTGDGARVPVAGIGGQALNHWVRRAWLAAAPAGLAAQAAAADRAGSGEVGTSPRRSAGPRPGRWRTRGSPRSPRSRRSPTGSWGRCTGWARRRSGCCARPRGPRRPTRRPRGVLSPGAVVVRSASRPW